MADPPIGPEAMPDPGARGFAEAIRRLDERLSEPEHAFRAALSDATKDRAYRFAALYGLLHRLRREERFHEYRDVARQYEVDFGDEDYYDTFRVVVARGHGADRAAMLRALEYSERAVEHLPEVSGVLHQYAEVVATLCDLVPSVSEDLLTAATTRVSHAIQLTSGRIPHYYATRARLNLELGHTETARADIADALSGEDGSSRDFARRISRYEGIRLLINISERQREFGRMEQRLKDEITEFRREQIQLLGLLAAVVAFLSASAGIAARATLVNGLQLIIASGGVISVVFAVLSIAFGAIRLSRWLPAIFAGLTLIVVALALPSALGR